MVDPGTISLIARVASCMFGPIRDYVVHPIARRCPSKHLWEYNRQNLETKLKELWDKGENVRGLTHAGVESLQDVNDWLDKATKIINEVLGVIREDNRQRQQAGCCEECSYSHLRECYQHRKNVARKLKDVDQHLQEAMESTGLWEYESNLKNLKKEVQKLGAKRDGVKSSIKVGEEPRRDVKEWLDDVKKIIDEVSGLTSERNPDQQNNVARMLKEVAQLLQEEAQFRQVSYQPVPEQTCLQPTIQQEASESRLSILKDIIAALTNADINMVGIYGMGGVGKTTLAKEVAREVKQRKLFEIVAFVEVSESPDIKNIQGVIGDNLGLQFIEETVYGRAIRLCEQLKKEEKILLILDNIWGSIDFEKIGIPFGTVEGLKLLLTTRNRDVLKDGMNSQHNFRIEILNEKDSWHLFEKIAGPCVQHPELQYVANDVVNACGGVPLAIVTTAKALKDKKVNEWKNAWREFRRPSPESFRRLTAKVHASIQLSYNQLESEELKDTFLLCSSMGRTHDASIQDLLRYALGLGLFTGINKLEEALDYVHTLV